MAACLEVDNRFPLRVGQQKTGVVIRLLQQHPHLHHIHGGIHGGEIRRLQTGPPRGCEGAGSNVTADPGDRVLKPPEQCLKGQYWFTLGGYGPVPASAGGGELHCWHRYDNRRPGLPGFQMKTAQLTHRTRVGRLLIRTAAGDQDAFTDLYREMSPRVYRLAQQMIVDSDLSQEITQDVFLQVWQKAHTFKASKGHPVAWLMMITHRRTLDRARAEHTSSNRNTAYAVATYTPDFDQTAETAINRLEEQDITRSLKTLSPIQREAINLAYYNGLTYQQVGAHLGIPLSTAKARIRDGLIRLKSSMGHS